MLSIRAGWITLALTRIQWMIGNHCNLQCVYCPVNLHAGSTPLPRSLDFKLALDRIADHFPELSIEFQGGEPTLYQPLVEWITDTELGASQKVVLHTNGTMLENHQWQAMLPNIGKIELTVHGNKVEQVESLIVLLVENQIGLSIKIPIMPETWKADMETYRRLKMVHTDVGLQMLYANYTRGNNRYLDYTDEQWDAFWLTRGIDRNAPVEVMHQQPEVRKQLSLNNYYGHYCSAGLEQLIIEPHGSVHKGWCRVDGTVGNIFDKNFVFPDQAVVCPFQQCSNGFDQACRKSQGSWGMANK